jgi:hypothetical protein
MTPPGSLMDLFRPATSLWRRGQRFFAGSRFVEGVFTWPRRAANRETLLGFLGFGAASPEEEARGLRLLQENLSPANGSSSTGGSGILMSSAETQASATGSSMVSS